jgi:hypothetical protein
LLSPFGGSAIKRLPELSFEDVLSRCIAISEAPDFRRLISAVISLSAVSATTPISL